MDRSKDLFDEEGDQLVRDYNDLEKYINIFDQAKINNTPLVVTVKDSQNWDTLECTLTFEATPNNISIIDGVTTFFFDNCHINGQLKATRTYYTFDDILDMYLPAPTDMITSFEIINDTNEILSQLTQPQMPITQIHESLMNTSLENSQEVPYSPSQLPNTPFTTNVSCSTPTSDINHQTLSDLTLSPVKRALPIVNNTDIGDITVHISPHYTNCNLYITDNKIDETYLKLFWKNHEQVLSYQNWLKHSGLAKAFSQHELFLTSSYHYETLLSENEFNAAQLYNQWYDSFSEHLMPFDDWYTSIKVPPPSTRTTFDIMSATRLIDVVKWQQDAYDLVDSERDAQERIRLEALRKHWALTLVKQHTYPFSEYLNTDLSSIQPFTAELEFQNELNNVKDPHWAPHMFLCLLDDSIAYHDFKNQSDFVLNRKHKAILNDPITKVVKEDFIPGQRFSRMFIPNYVHLPSTMATTMRLEDVVSLIHIQHIIWSRLQAAHREAYQNFHINKLSNVTTPLEQLKDSKLQSEFYVPITIPDCLIAQQSHARIYEKRQGGASKLYRAEFYDLFIRPLEFLVGRGMPMHRLLLEAAYDFAERCNLFKLLLEFSGHSIDMDIPCDIHWFFSEITKIRHLHAYDLLPGQNLYSPPLLRLEALPKSPEHSNPAFTKPLPTIDPVDFTPNHRFEHFVPHKFLPLPLHILDRFSSHGGQKMNINTHIRLHDAFLQTYERFIDKYGLPETPTFQDDNDTDLRQHIRHNERGLQFQQSAQAMSENWDAPDPTEDNSQGRDITSPSLLPKPTYAQKIKTSYPIPKKRQDKVLPKPKQLAADFSTPTPTPEKQLDPATIHPDPPSILDAPVPELTSQTTPPPMTTTHTQRENPTTTITANIDNPSTSKYQVQPLKQSSKFDILQAQLLHLLLLHILSFNSPNRNRRHNRYQSHNRNQYFTCLCLNINKFTHTQISLALLLTLPHLWFTKSPITLRFKCQIHSLSYLTCLR